jgi:hypothetical protein
MVYPELKELILFSKHIGETNDDFFAMFEAEIGPMSEDWSETFTFNVVSPKWLHKTLKTNGIEIGHGMLLMNQLNVNLVESTVKKLLSQCERMTWEEVVFSICRYARWEYE